jgi:hypothetical protein
VFVPCRITAEETKKAQLTTKTCPPGKWRAITMLGAAKEDFEADDCISNASIPLPRQCTVKIALAANLNGANNVNHTRLPAPPSRESRRER